MLKNKYPQPEAGELEAAPVYGKAFNPYLWRLVQGKIAELTNPFQWEDFTEEIESAIQGLMIPDAEEEIMKSISVMARRTTDLVNNHDTTITIPFNAAQTPFTAGLWNLDASGKYFVADRVGWWRFDAQITWGVQDTGHRRYTVLKTYAGSIGGTEIVFTYLRQSSGGSRSTFIAHSTPVYMEIGDSLELQAWQNSGVNISIIGSVLNHVWARFAYEGEVE